MWIAVGALALLLPGANPLSGQLRGAVLPLDHPAHPVAEWLVARGVLEGLDGSLRPFPLKELRRAVERAVASAGVDGPTPPVAWLAEAVLEELPEGSWGTSVEVDLGALAYTDPTRELLLAESGEERVVDLQAVRFGMEFGPASLQIEPRRLRRGREVAFPVGMGRAEWRWGWVQWGEVERNWGPPGVSGLLVSPLAGGRTEFAFALGPDPLRFEFRSSVLDDGVSLETGDPVARYWSSHRLRWRPGEAVEVAIWETTVSAEEGGPDAARSSPFTSFTLFGQQGRADDRNVVVGLDASWRVSPGLLLETQLALDDFIGFSDDDNPYPHRYGFTVQARGAGGARGAWRAYATALSGLALNTFDPAEAYLDGGSGIGRQRPDHVEAGAFWSLASGYWSSDRGGPGQGFLGGARAGWPGQGILSAGLRWRRQGVRRFTDPFPDLDPGEERLPAFSPEIEREVWALITQADWIAGPFVVQGEAQLQRRRFPDSGLESEWGLEGRLQLVWRLGPWSWQRGL